MANVFLILAVVGAVVPYVFFTDFFLKEGLTGDFIGSLFVNGAAGGFTADLLITSLAFWIYLWHTRVQRLWMYVLVNLTIGLSCALPLYLYMRLRDEGAMAATAD